MAGKRLLIGYYRLSMEDDSSEKESNSITNQRMLVKDFIREDQELSEMPFKELYDDGYSGATLNRPAMQELLNLIRQEKVGCIVVKDFSRFSRDYIELGTYLEQILPFMRIHFISISDRYDSRDYIGKTLGLDSQFKGLLADFYVKDQSVKVKTAVAAKRENGQYCSGSAPFGYQRNPENKTELLIVEEEAEIIRRVFDLTNQRYSKMEICRMFNEEGIPTPLQLMAKRQKVDNRKAESKHLQWTSDMVRSIINDRNYIGCMVYGKTKIPDPGSGKEIVVPKDQWKVMENHHEAIVTKEVFEQAQALQIRYSRKGKINKGTSLLGGYLKCANCGRSLTGSKELHGHVLYSCAYSKGKEDTGCFAGKADNKILEIIIFNEIKVHLQQMISQEQMDASMRQQHQKQILAYQNEISDCKKAQEGLKQQHRKNYEKYHEGEWTREQFQETREQMELSVKKLEKRVQELKEMICGEEEILTKKNIPVEQMMKYLGYEKLTREMLEEYVEGVAVHDDGRIEVRWKTLA